MRTVHSNNSTTIFHPMPSSSQSSNSPPADPNASIQSILAASNNSKSNTPNGQLPVWSLVQPEGPHSQPLNSGKRKLDDPETDDPHSKIRRIVRDHVSHDPSRVVPMTTVICLHAAVAQKSYGSEKRFLCPPPVVHIQGPTWHMRTQQLHMSIISESGERVPGGQRTSLDNSMTASFKFLHVTGTAKAKSFQLSLDIAEPPSPLLSPEGADPLSGRVWASFDSAPVTIISKPSKKTAKTRNISSCILAGGPVSLFNRINSQTVRTKYMTIDHAQLCASNVAWSAFNVNVVRRPSDSTPHGGPQPVTYGCEIILSDVQSGISTAPLVIRKVDKGRVSADDGGPVSQMQKIALQRLNPDGSRHYLSAAGPMPGTPGVVPPPAPGMSGQAGTHPLLFQSPRVRDEVKDGVRMISDEVDDYLCWTIVGISKFQYTFFDAFGQNNSLPDAPITPFPTLFTSPVYRPANNTIELTVSNFFYEDPKTRTQTPLDVYLGNLGPLRQRIYSAAAPGPLTTISPYVNALTGPQPDNGAGPSGEQQVATGGSPSSPTNGVSSPGPPRYMPTGPLHTIVVVEMPPLADVLKSLEEDVPPTNSNGDAAGSAPHSPRPRNENGSTNGSSAAVTNGNGSNGTGPSGDSSNSINNGNGVAPTNGTNNPTLPPPPLAGRSLPLLFIRASDGVGYHSGRTIACENVFQSMDLASIAAGAGGSGGNVGAAGLEAGWLAAAQAAAAADGGLHGWTLRVM